MWQFQQWLRRLFWTSFFIGLALGAVMFVNFDVLPARVFRAALATALVVATVIWAIEDRGKPEPPGF